MSDMLKALEKIDEHFENVSEEELELNLIDAGFSVDGFSWEYRVKRYFKASDRELLDVDQGLVFFKGANDIIHAANEEYLASRITEWEKETDTYVQS